MNGIYIAEKTDRGTRGVYIDADTVECALLNARVRRRLERREAGRRQARRRHARKAAAARFVTGQVALACAAGAGCLAGLVHPAVAAALGAVCLLRAGVRLGKEEGR